MDDRYDPNLILGYVEGELTAADRARVAAILADDPALGALVADLERDRAALRNAKPIEPPHDLADSAIAAIERQLLFEDHTSPAASSAASSRRYRLVPLLTYGGIAAVLALTVTVVFQSLRSDPSSTATVALSDAPKPGMSLAEATLEAQHKAAASGGSVNESADAVTHDAAGLVAESLAQADLDGIAAADDSALLAETTDALTPTPTDTLAMLETAPARQNASRADMAIPAASRGETFADAARFREANTAASAPVAASQDALADATLAAEAVALDEAPADSFAMMRSQTPPTPAVIAPVSPPPLATTAPLDHRRASADLAVAAELEIQALGGTTAAKTRDTKLQSAPVASQRYTLNIVTPSPDRSLLQLNAWAAQNNVAVTPDLPAGGGGRAGGESDVASFVAADAITEQALATPQRVTLTIPVARVPDLVAALSEPDHLGRQDVVPLQPWMNWQAPLQRAEVQVVIESAPR